MRVQGSKKVKGGSRSKARPGTARRAGRSGKGNLPGKPRAEKARKGSGAGGRLSERTRKGADESGGRGAKGRSNVIVAASNSRAAKRKLSLRLRYVLSVSDELGSESTRREFSVAEGRVPRSWSPERRQEVLAAKLRRKIRADRVARTLNVLGSAHRLRILGTLAGGAATYRQLVKTTKLRAGPLYHHVNQLRLAGLLRPKERDLYEITARGKRHLLMAAAMGSM